MNTIDRLASLFSKFPGIGLRQAHRFVYFLLSAQKDFLPELISLLASLKAKVRECASCYRFFEGTTKENICSLCAESDKKPLLIIVEKDVDLENIRKSKIENSAYFVLGGLHSPFAQDSSAVKGSSARMQKLIARVKTDIENKTLQEIILAFGAESHGDYTALHIKKILTQLVAQNNIKITTLGRGMSTGTEIEYSDAETLKNAFDNRR